MTASHRLDEDDPWRDGVYTEVGLRFPIRARLLLALQLLFGWTFYVNVDVKTEHEVGATDTMIEFRTERPGWMPRPRAITMTAGK